MSFTDPLQQLTGLGVDAAARDRAAAADPDRRGRFVETGAPKLLQQIWPVAAITVAVIGVAAGEIVVALVGSAVLIAGFIARWWGRNVLRHLTVSQTIAPTHAFVGETLDLTVRLENRKLLPLPWLRVRMTFPEVLPPHGYALEPSGMSKLSFLFRMTGMRWYERLTWRYRVPLKLRGYYEFGETQLQSGDLFGVFRRQRIDPGPNKLWVYPEVVELPRLGIPQLRPHGDARGGQRIFEDPTRLRALRDYQSGDALKRVDWKATARRQALQSRVYDPSSSPVAVVALNVSTLPDAWQGFYGDVFERAVSVAASLASAYVEERTPVGLLANCTYPNQDATIRVPASRAPGHLLRIFEALAMADVFTLVSMDRLLEEEGRRLPFGSSLALVTAVVTPRLEAALVRLVERGIGVAPIYLGIDDPPVEVAGLPLTDIREALRDLEYEKDFLTQTWSRVQPEGAAALEDDWAAPADGQPAPAVEGSNPWARPPVPRNGAAARNGDGE